MFRCILFIIVLFSLIACSSEKESYYRKNPQALQSAILNCPEKNPFNIDCEQLDLFSKRMKELAYQLQRSPLGFGKKILKLQSDLADQQNQLLKGPHQEEIKNKIQLIQEDLMNHFTIVKWLESPK